MKNSLKEAFGNIDIYLFDQLLKGRFDHAKKIIDVGCGNGRNLVYFLRNNFEVYGIDPNPNAIEQAKLLSVQIAPEHPLENFRVGKVEDKLFKEEAFDVVICNAVLHFARDQDHFDEMLRSIWSILKPGGFMFTRLASNIGIENLVKDLGRGIFYLPDGSERFLVDEKTLLDYTKELNGILFEPIKTTNVQNLRCMTTWCVQKKLI
jgi:tellurite methyltransferase